MSTPAGSPDRPPRLDGFLAEEMRKPETSWRCAKAAYAAARSPYRAPLTPKGLTP